MNDTRVSVLTPPGAGAIATVAVAGPRAWALARQLFRPAGTRPLPDAPERHRFWFGTLGDGVGDEVVLAVKQTDPEPHVEVHCHGGRRVVRWVVEQFLASGGRQPPESDEPSAWHGLGGLTPPARQAIDSLTRAPTVRTASVLLDQYHGVFDRAVRAVLADLESAPPERSAEPLAALARFAPLGRHLVDPWKVVIAGPPNVGKSSLVNALAGYQRSVVSEVAGTTRDVVTVPVAFDGWPVELADTAGLRDAAGLEAAGIDRAKQVLAEANVTLWVLDATVDEPDTAGINPAARQSGSLVVINKIDRPAGWDLSRVPDALRVSAVTGEGVPGLVAAVARQLVPDPPPPGAAVPFTPHLAGLVEAAHAACADGRPADAARFLRGALPPA